MEHIKKLPRLCPSCQSHLRVESLRCPSCETSVRGEFALPAICSLEKQEQDFILDFVKSSGSLKEMARKMGLSYPSVRNFLDDIIEKLKKTEEDENDQNMAI